MSIDLVEAYVHESAALVALARRGPIDAPVPSCPGWDVLGVVRHAGRVARMTAFGITKGAAPGRDDLPLAPKDPDAAISFLEEGVEALAVLLRTTPADQPAWVFLDAPAVAGFWSRRMAHEAAVHRWDAEGALVAAAGSGEHHDPSPIDAELAADGIDELLQLFLPDGAPTGDELPPGSLHVHCTDTEGEWTLRPGADGPVVEVGHAKGDAALRGPASDLLLAVWGRLPVDAPTLEMFGDVALVPAWLSVGRR